MAAGYVTMLYGQMFLRCGGVSECFCLNLKLMWSTRATRHFLPVNDGKTALSALVGCVAVVAPNHFSFLLFRLPHFRLEHTTRVCLLPKLDTN